VAAGIANPSDTAPSEGGMYASTRPVTPAAPFARAPPELPGDTAASVWISPTSDCVCDAEPGISRFSPEITTGCYTVREPERAADHHREIAELRLRGHELRRRQPRTVGLHHREVGDVVRGLDRRVHLLPVHEADLDALARTDDVRVRHDQSIGGPDDAAAQTTVRLDRDHRRLQLPRDDGHLRKRV